MREPEITVNGTVTGVLRGAYEVELANGLMVRPMLSGRMMRHKIRVTVGRNVRSWGEAEGADRQTPLNSVENDPKRTSAGRDDVCPLLDRSSNPRRFDGTVRGITSDGRTVCRLTRQ
jgi:hypothetical protein